jgi:hypothetical protein
MSTECDCGNSPAPHPLYGDDRPPGIAQIFVCDSCRYAFAVTDEQYAKAMKLVNTELEDMRAQADLFAARNIRSDTAWQAAIESHRQIDVLEHTVRRNIDTFRKDNP